MKKGQEISSAIWRFAKQFQADWMLKQCRVYGMVAIGYEWQIYYS